MSALRRFGQRMWHGWLAIAGHFGEIQTLVVLGLVYGVVMGPVAIGTWVGRRDFLDKRRLGQAGSAWRDSEARKAELENVKQPF